MTFRHEGHPAVLRGTASYVLNSTMLEQSVRVEVSMPVRYEEDESRCYPVVYVIDGYWFFPLISSIARHLEVGGEIPPVIVVGIGYELDNFTIAQEDDRVSHLRCRDLTPTTDPSDWWRTAAAGRQLGAGIETGHADEFMRVIEREIKPLVRTRHRCDTSDETLAGYSLGGLFALYVLLRYPKSFKRYVAGSPSLWWDDEVIFEIEREYAEEHRDLDGTLFISVGGLEEFGTAAACKMLTNVRRLADQLLARKYPSLHHHSAILENETHASGIAATFVKGLIAVFRRPAGVTNTDVRRYE